MAFDAPQAIDGSQYVGFGQELNAETIIGTKWALDREITLEFKADGIVMANGALKAHWTLSHHDIYITSNLQDIWLSIIGDELFFQGHPVKRLQ